MIDRDAPHPDYQSDVDRFLDAIERLTADQWREVAVRHGRVTATEWEGFARMLMSAGEAMRAELGGDRQEFKRQLDLKKAELQRAMDIIGRLPADMRVEGSALFHEIRHAASVRLASYRTRRWWLESPMGERADTVFRSLFTGLVPGE